MTFQAGCTQLSRWTAGGVCNPDTCPGAPFNDECVLSPQIALGAELPGTTFRATGTDITACSNTNSDVWYTFQPPVPGTYQVTTHTTRGQVGMAAFMTCPPVPNSEFTCTLQSSLQGDNSLYLTLSTTALIHLRVADYDVAPFPSFADFTIRVDTYSVGTPPANDGCYAESPFLTAGVPASGSNTDAHSDLPFPICNPSNDSGSRTGRDVFYRFIPTCTGNYTISSCGGSFWSVLDVLSDCSGSAASRLYCADGFDSDFCHPGEHFLDPHAAIQNAALTAGQLYYIRLSGYGNLDNSQMGLYQLLVTSAAPCHVGACCDGATCSLILPAACSGPTRHFAGENVACNLPGNNSTPCSRGDFNQSGGTSVQDIFDFLAAYFSNDPRADVNGSGTVTVQDIFSFLAAYFGG